MQLRQCFRERKQDIKKAGGDSSVDENYSLQRHRKYYTDILQYVANLWDYKGDIAVKRYKGEFANNSEKENANVQLRNFKKMKKYC